MTKLAFASVSLLALSMLLVPELPAQFQTLQTKNLRVIYYDPSHSYVLPHLTRCFENSLRFHRTLFRYTPSEEITVLLEDFDDYGYAGATSLPYNYLRLGIEPYKYDYETSPTNERFNWVMNHELVHIVASDKASSSDRVYRSLFFGKVAPTSTDPVSMFYSFLTNPRKYAPRWYHEGMAVFMETWMAGGIGRALGGWDEMVFRTMVRDKSYIYDVVGLESEGTTIDFQVGANSYLYGTRFISYAARLYGPEKVIQWVSRTDDSDRDFASQFERVFGSSLEDEWSRWSDWERSFQKANLDSIRRYPVTSFRAISERPLGSVSRAFYDPARGKIYAAVNYPGQLAHIAAIDIKNGRMQKICDVLTPALYYVCSLAYDSSTETLFFTTNNSKDWRNVYMVDVRSGSTHRLLRDARIGDLVFNRADRSLWGIRHNIGISTVVRIPPPYTEWHSILSLDYGKDLFDIDISPDGSSLTGSFVGVNGKQSLIQMDVDRLQKGESSYEVLMEFENNTSPENFTFSPDGKYLVGTSYYTGVSNIFRFNIAKKSREVLSNAESGFFRPVPVSDDSLVAFHYTGRGFVPVMMAATPREDVSAIQYLGQEIVETYPQVQKWTLGSPLSIKFDSVTTFEGEYNGLASIKLQSIYPIVQGYKDYTTLGFRFNFLDPLQLDNIDASISYAPAPRLASSEKFHGSLAYTHWPWKITGAYNRADFYDLFGPTKVSRKGYSLGVRYNDYVFYDRPRTLEYTLVLTGYAGLERLPEFQNIAVSYDNFLTFNARLDYQDLRRSLGAVEYEEGWTSELSSYNRFAVGKVYPALNANLDYGFLLSLDHSSIWFRTAAGYSFGDRNESFSNFYFGGFGNNWVDYQNEKRYREFLSLPGMQLNSIAGTNFVKGMLEWTLPPLRFRRLGIPAIYCTWARLALFTSGILTNLGSNPERRKAVNAGAQVDFHLSLFWRLDSTLSFGYAVAAEKDQRLSNEFMVSLKIL
jgi:hypothetical protein